MGKEVAGKGGPPPTSLAPGFRFHPTDEELVRYYLRRKACRKPFRFEAVTEIDVYKSEPWELADHSSMKSRDLEWYFFSPVDRKYGNGSRLNRATGQGYWKATGKDRPVRHKSQTIGMKKTLVFHSGRAPDGKRTNWVMHEYRLCDSELETAGVSQDAFVLCRIFQKSGLGPPNGDRYAPFIEEEWDEDVGLLVPGGDVDDDMTNGEEARIDCTDIDQDTPALCIAPLGMENPNEPHNIPFMCKRERSQDRETSLSLSQGKKRSDECEPTLSLSQGNNKRSKHDDPNSSNANGSEDSTTSQQNLMMTINSSPALLEFPLLEPNNNSSNKEATHHAKSLTFDSSNLEKSVPPGYLKFISNLENEILSLSMEKETIKIEVMRAQAMINILQSNFEIISRENDELKRTLHNVVS